MNKNIEFQIEQLYARISREIKYWGYYSNVRADCNDKIKSHIFEIISYNSQQPYDIREAQAKALTDDIKNKFRENYQHAVHEHMELFLDVDVSPNPPLKLT